MGFGVMFCGFCVMFWGVWVVVWGRGSVFGGLAVRPIQPVPNWGGVLGPVLGRPELGVLGRPVLARFWGVQCVPNELFIKDLSGGPFPVHVCTHVCTPGFGARFGVPFWGPVRPRFGVQFGASRIGLWDSVWVSGFFF